MDKKDLIFAVLFICLTALVMLPLVMTDGDPWGDVSRPTPTQPDRIGVAEPKLSFFLLVVLKSLCR
jgi:hypothetical protein